MKKKYVLLLTLFFLAGCASQTLKASKQDFDAGDYSQALQKMLPLAERGNADAEYAVGYMYYNGQGTPVNKQKGFEWINKAAEQGQIEAQQAKFVLERQKTLNPLGEQ